jgi:hypothetical protein
MGNIIPDKISIPFMFTLKVIEREHHCSRLPLLVTQNSAARDPHCTSYPVVPVDVLRIRKSELSDTVSSAIDSPKSKALHEKGLLMNAHRKEMLALREAHRMEFDNKYNALMNKKSAFWTKLVFDKKAYNLLTLQIANLKTEFTHNLRNDIMKLKRKQLWVRNMHNLHISHVSHNLSIIKSKVTQIIPTPIQLQVTRFNQRLKDVCRL